MRSSTRNPVVLGTIIVGLAAAMLAPGAAISQTTAPEPLSQAQPEAPTNRFGMPIEGWAIVRYSVLPDGTTDDVRVIDRMPLTIPEKDMRNAVESWTFKPAMSGGKAVEWHHGEAVIRLDAEQVPSEPSQMFVRGYREVEGLIEMGELKDALQRNQRLLGMETSRLAEMGVGLVQAARINMAMDNMYEAYAAIERATDPRLMLLEQSELPVALQYRNTLELELGDYVGALATLARREEMGPVPSTDVMESNVAKIKTALDGDAAIAIKGKIIDDTWTHDLSRRTIAIGDLEGSLKTIALNCDYGGAEFEFSIESEWGLPESWGACTVTVSGKKDSEFNLYEFKN